MQANEYHKFIEVLSGVHDFYGKDLSEFASEVWWQALKDFELKQVSRSFSAHLQDVESGRFMPKPADVLRQLGGTSGERSLMAWSKVFDAMGTVGAYNSVTFDDAIIHCVIEDLGGWPKLCRENTDTMQFVQKRFCDAYKAYASRGVQSHPGYLAGVYEIENASAKNPHRALSRLPWFVGDAEKAKQVLLSGSGANKTPMVSSGMLLAGMSIGKV